MSEICWNGKQSGKSVDFNILNEKAKELVNDVSSTAAAFSVCQNYPQKEILAKAMVNIFTERELKHFKEIARHLEEGNLKTKLSILSFQIESALKMFNCLTEDDDNGKE